MSCQDKFHILAIRDFSITFRQYSRFMKREELPVIAKLNVTVHEGEIVALVGASGSGKSLLAHGIMGLLPSNARMEGELLFMEEPLTLERVRKIRGKEIAFVPQGVTYLDPLMKVGAQVRERRSGPEGRARQEALFSAYGLPAETAEKYPFECSGGMSRRILLSTALMENPRLIVADEPTPGMDLEQAKKAMEDFRRFADEGNGVLLITHDVPMALSVADRIAVFYAGTTVEEAPAGDFANESLLRHPYTRALLSSIPIPSIHVKRERILIQGELSSPIDPKPGCRFASRCPYAKDVCRETSPELREISPGHHAACHFAGQCF